jgi:molecular chaperone GrpE
MNDKPQRPEAAFEAEVHKSAAGKAAAANENAEAATPAAPAEPDPVAELTQANAAMKDQLLRTLADMENLRKRTEREVAEARLYSVTNFARDVLSAADNIRRALESTGEEWKATADASGQALYDGVELTERELLKVLEKYGIKKIVPMGEKFDPNLHQAMFKVPDPSVPANTVVQVLQAGFVINDTRILRPALVGVAEGGPKAPAEPQSKNAPAN